MKLSLESAMSDREMERVWTNIFKENKPIRAVKNTIHNTFGDN